MGSLARRSAASLAVALLACGAAVARAQESSPPPGGLVPVPASWLAGTRLVLERADCSIDAPAPEWRWLCTGAESQGVIQVRCQGPEPEARVFFEVEEERLGRLTTDKVDDFIRQLDEAYAKSRGLTVEKVACEPSDVPIAGHSFRFTNKLVDARGAVTFSHGYVASARRIYVLGELSRSEVAPRELGACARSFQLTKAEPDTAPLAVSPRPPQLSAGLIAAVIGAPLAVMLVAGSVFVVAWKRHARRQEKDERSPPGG